MRHNLEGIERDRRAPSDANGDWISDLPNDLDCLALRPVGGDAPGRIDELARDGLVSVRRKVQEPRRHGGIA